MPGRHPSIPPARTGAEPRASKNRPLVRGRAHHPARPDHPARPHDSAPRCATCCTAPRRCISGALLPPPRSPPRGGGAGPSIASRLLGERPTPRCPPWPQGRHIGAGGCLYPRPLPVRRHRHHGRTCPIRGRWGRARWGPRIGQAANDNAQNYHLSPSPMRFAAHTALRVRASVWPPQAVTPPSTGCTGLRRGRPDHRKPPRPSLGRYNSGRIPEREWGRAPRIFARNSQSPPRNGRAGRPVSRRNPGRQPACRAAAP